MYITVPVVVQCVAARPNELGSILGNIEKKNEKCDGYLSESTAKLPRVFLPSRASQYVRWEPVLNCR